MNAFPYIIQGQNIVVVIDNKTHTVSKTHLTYAKVLAAIKAQDWALVKKVIEPAKVVIAYGKGNVSIQDGELLWKGEAMHGYLSTKILDMLNQGLPVEPMVNFMHNLMSNPSRRAVTELYGFLEKGGMPITPDGYFLAYKKVRANYKDCHSGTMDNSVGKVVEMERNGVDDDKDRTCSAGLHFCSQGYLNHFGGDRIMIVKVNPADVVSIPTDYNDAKGRACRYTVIGELEGESKSAPEKAFTSAVQSNGNGVALGGWPFAKAAPEPIVALSHKQIMARVDTLVRTSAAQDYDKNGNALSMTKDAIRKRKARATKAAQAKMAVARSGGWPNPAIGRQF